MLVRRSNTVHNANSKHRSFWLQEIAGDAPDAPALQGGIKTDVAIAGGGYVGLWTAIRIKELMPACDVTVIEQDICGGGASGRNGGFVLSWIPKLEQLYRGDNPADDVVCRAVNAACRRLEDLGVVVVDTFSPAFDSIQQCASTILSFEAFRSHRAQLELSPHAFGERCRRALERGATLSAN
jgi:2-polyprenyl-6-methoxyphenol hydroxylase-like FAD-dependent oxidoreductase